MRMLSARNKRFNLQRCRMSLSTVICSCPLNFLTPSDKAILPSISSAALGMSHSTTVFCHCQSGMKQQNNRLEGVEECSVRSFVHSHRQGSAQAQTQLF